MTKLSVFATRNRVPEAISLLKNHFEVEVWEDNSIPPNDVLIKKASEHDGIFCESDDPINAEVLKAGKNKLKIVASRSVGLDHIDVKCATECGIIVSNTPGVLIESCADFTFGLILNIARRLSEGDRNIRAGKWLMFDQMPYRGTDIHGATLGLLGMGGIASAVAKRAKGFNMNVIYFSRTRKSSLESELNLTWVPDLSTLLGNSDFLSIHVPLTPETEGIIGESELRLMKPEAYLINTSRGKTVNSDALYQALKSGVIKGAGIDVTDPEPLDTNDPLISLDNILITPHIASASSATFTNMGLLSAENLIAALNGEKCSNFVNV